MNESKSAVQSGFSLSPEQDAARAAILRWWKSASSATAATRAARGSQIFCVAGYAGTGKSTIVKAVVAELGLPDAAVAYVTFTGKAALVLNRKGTPAVTIHRLIYIPVITKYIDKDGRPKEKVSGFKLRKPDDESLGTISLIVVDEVSMVGGSLLSDLLSFGIPVLALGDPGQLPPVLDNGNRLSEKADVFLTKVHRQAADNPILWASMRIREGHSLPYGVYGGTHPGDAPLSVVPQSYITHEMLAAADQVICGRNETRQFLNQGMRTFLGRSGLPEVGDKLICLKNNWTEASSTLAPLINGWLGRVSKLGRVDRRRRTCILNVEDWDDSANEFFALETNLDFFEQAKGSTEKPNTHSKVEHFDYGYAITCHKSQGSEFDSVVYVHEPFGGADIARKLLYTGITRASRSLVIVI
jgi:exodeoxyribonuclease-5